MQSWAALLSAYMQQAVQGMCGSNMKCKGRAQRQLPGVQLQRHGVQS
jgi:hypothetical protein